jgi:predicted regulator of Ras-like GTPase activity (Roadblock/LC7/MglB family)
MTAAAPSELGLRILTIKALEDLRGILNEITRHEEVVGWAIIGSDGLMVAGSLPDELNSENLAVRALSIYMGTEAMLEGIGNERLQQIILYTEMGAVFVANFGEGIFITISNATQPDKIIRTLKKIRDVS